MSLPIPDVWRVNATVKLPNGNPFTQGKVVAYDIHGSSTNWLGEAGLDGSGKCTITYSKSQFQLGDSTRTNPNLKLEVISYSGNTKLYVSTILDLASSEQLVEIDLVDTTSASGTVVWNPGQNSLIGSTTPAVYGWIKNKAGLPVSELSVIAYQLVLLNGVPSRIQLGNVKVSDNDGYYAIPYSITDLRHVIGTTPPNQIQVDIVPVGKPTITSAVVKMNNARLRIDMTVDLKSEADNSEYSQLERAIYALLKTKNLSTEYIANPSHCTYLAGQIGWAEDKVTAYARAWNIWRQMKMRVHDYNKIVKLSYGITPPAVDLFNPDTSSDDEIIVSSVDYAYKLGQFTFEGVNLTEYLLAPAFFYGITRSKLVDNFDEALELTSGRIFKTVTGALNTKLIPDYLNKNLDARFAKWQEVVILILSRSVLSQNKFAALLGDIAIRTSVAATIVTNDIPYDVSNSLNVYMNPNGSGEIEPFINSVNLWKPSLLGCWNLYLLVHSKMASNLAKYAALMAVVVEHASKTETLTADVVPVLLKQALSAYFESEGDLGRFTEIITDWDTSTQGSWNQYQKDRLLFALDVHARLTEGFLPSTMAVLAYGGISLTDSWYSFIKLSSLVGKSENEWIDVAEIASIYSIESYSTDKSRWQAFLPSSFPGANLQEQCVIYARKLAKKIEALFPQTVAITKLDSLLEEYEDTATTPERKAELEVIVDMLGMVPDFCSTHPDWKLDSTSPAEIDMLTVGMTNETERDALRTQLKLLLRIYRLTSNLETAIALIRKKYTSAYSISRIPEDEFVADVFLDVGSFEDPRKIHRLASHYSSETLFQVTLNKQSLNLQDDAMKSIPRVGYTGKFPTNQGLKANDSSPDGTKSQGNANWNILFGNPIQCSCKECQSVYGAASYFVDLVEFLPKSLRQTLMSRRKDVLDMTLTCQNTNTLVPYIDLVNEILENLVAKQLFTVPIENLSNLLIENTDTITIGNGLISAMKTEGFPLSSEATIAKGTISGQYLVIDGSWRYIVKTTSDNGNFTSATVLPTPQTSWSADKLAAFPEHLNRKAYDTLAGEFYPFSLPFDLWDVETRLYLNTLGIPRYKALEAMKSNSIDSSVLATREKFAARDYFGLSLTQYKLVTGETTKDSWKLWGFETNSNTEKVVLSSDSSVSYTGTWIDLLSVVSVFLDRTGLSLDDARTVLAMSYVRGDIQATLPITVLPHTEIGYQSCATNDLRISGLDASRLVKIANILRIWKATGWSLQELDVYLCAFTQADTFIDLVALYKFQSFQAKYSLQLVDAIALLQGMTHAIVPGTTYTLYQKTFLHGEYSDNLNSELAALPSALCGEAGSVPGNDVDSDTFWTVLARGIGLTTANLGLLVANATTLAGADAKFVDYLYQTAALCRVLKLSVSDYLDAQKLLAGELRNFTMEGIDAVQAKLARLQSFDISFRELKYLISNTDADTFDTNPKDIRAFFDELIEQAQTIRKAYEVPEVLGQENLTAEQVADLADEKQKRDTELRTAITALVESQLATQLELSNDVVKYLLETVLESTDFTRSTDTALSDWSAVGEIVNNVIFRPTDEAYHLVAKVARVLTGLGIDQNLLQFFYENSGSLPSTFGWNKFSSTMNWSDMEALVERCWMVTHLDLSQEAVLSIWRSVIDQQSVLDELAETWKVSVSDLEWLLDEKRTGISNADLNPNGVYSWIRLHNAFMAFRKSGLTTGQLEKLVFAEPTMDTTLALRETMQERMGSDAWYTKIAPARNQLRERQRDALVAYLTSRPIENYSFKTTTDLYDHFLIDTQMNSEVKTSRLVRATNSVQLLVRRSLWGLENNGFSELNDEQKEQWKWMENYRVWQANRKVFLYPENWLEPELRDDKTQLFRELEEELNQGDIDEDKAEKALYNYLEKLRTLSNLCIIGAYRAQGGMDGVTSVLHVVGRTHSLPYKYYYRKYNQKDALKGIWEPWTAVGIEIGSPNAIPAFFNERLYLFWPTYQIIDQPKKDDEFTSTGWYGTDTNSSNKIVATSGKIVQIQMNWVEFQGGVWSSIKQTENSVFHADNPIINFDPRSPFVSGFYNFRAEVISSDILQVLVFDSHDDDVKTNTSNGAWESATQKLKYLGGFAIGKAGQTVSFQATEEQRSGEALVSDVYPSRTRVVFNVGVETNIADAKGTSADTLSYPKGNILLYNTPDGFWVMPTNFDFLVNPEQPQNTPFFYSDQGHTYLVEPVTNSYQDGFSAKTQKAYRFSTISHPLVEKFMERLTRDGIPSMMGRDTQALPAAEASYYSYNYYNYYFNVYLGYMIAGDWRAWDLAQDQFAFRYLPNNSVAQPYPTDVVDFDFGSSMGIYNWELFFHVPLMIAQALGKNQKYEEAFRWFHNIFDPKERLNGYERAQRWTSNLPSGARYWKFLPFFANPDAKLDEAESIGLANSNSRPDKGALATLVDEWKNNPFNPHLIARHRVAAYQKSVVMKYLDNLIAWGDQLFLQDTMESVNLATQLYMLAGDLLGKRPEEVPSFLERAPLSFNDLERLHTDALGNTMVGAEDAFLTTSATMRDSTQRGLRPQTKQALNVAVRMLYFGTPRNENLLHYWDTVSDRLFKIRNSMNLSGAKRQLALFAPPIDPGMLVRAAAAGLDLGAVLAGTSAPLPNYRFRRWISKAMELANDVKSLGGQLLAALEKKDGEALSLLRGKQETDLLLANKLVRQMQIDEAEENIKVLQKNRAATEARYVYYRDIDKWIGAENQQINLMAGAQALQIVAQVSRLLSGTVEQIPDMYIGALVGLGGGPITLTHVAGGSKQSGIPSSASTGMEIIASSMNVAASIRGIKASQDRRWEDWKLQERLAEKELASIDQQILGAEIRREIAKQELTNLELQIRHSQETYTFLSTKYTNKELYSWMVGEVGKLHNKAFQLATEVAKKAERTYQFELGLDGTSTDFVKSGYWDSLHKGLLAGERLAADLQRMDVAYLDNNKREQEVVKTVSLAQFAPDQLQMLRDNGSCTIEVPEWLLDLDFPGQYMRRIRAVRVTIPCVAGPHTSIGGRLTLTSNSIRKKKDVTDPYYIINESGIVGSPQVSISQGISDSGMFEMNFNDERYLPFEGAGAISTWELALAGCEENGEAGLRTFDYSTIGDVVLQISFTAREDSVLRKAAKAEISNLTERVLANKKLIASVSLKREFPDTYEAILAGEYGDVTFADKHFPYIFRGTTLSTESYSVSIRDKNGDMVAAELNVRQKANGDTWESLTTTPCTNSSDGSVTVAGTIQNTVRQIQVIANNNGAIDDIILSFTFNKSLETSNP